MTIAQRMSRDEALKWNALWSIADRRRIEEQFDRLGVVGFYSPPSGGYVGCEDRTGRRVMFLSPGYVEFKKDVVPLELCEPTWPGFALSTFRHRAAGADFEREGLGNFCPVHGLLLPLTGLCDDCAYEC